MDPPRQWCNVTGVRLETMQAIRRRRNSWALTLEGQFNGLLVLHAAGESLDSKQEQCKLPCGQKA